MTRPAPFIASILAAILLLFGAYMGSYYGMLEDKVFVGNSPGTLRPVYRQKFVAMDSILEPAHQIDRRLRSHRWSLENAFFGD